MTGHESVKIQMYCAASFAPGGRRSRSDILTLLVDQVINRASLILWQSRRQTLIALSAPDVEVVALSEALMPSVIIHDACSDIGLSAGVTPEVLFIIKTDSQATLTQLRNESVTTRSRPVADLLARIVCRQLDKSRSLRACASMYGKAGSGHRKRTTFSAQSGSAGLTEVCAGTMVRGCGTNVSQKAPGPSFPATGLPRISGKKRLARVCFDLA